ncbi:hypothetical protein [Microbacterium binotii]|uniref:hypothetical protein n=1 Tax=Microbacterium binotii TaxID=462710 RepID=UPI0031D3DF51
MSRLRRSRRPGVRLAFDLTTLGLVGALLIAALGAGTAALYQEFYSPSAFVQRYLNMLESGRAADALALPGVSLDSSELTDAGLPASASDALLRSAALSSLTDAHVVSEQVDGADTVVTASYVAGGHDGTTSFRVRSNGSLGIIPTWRFSQSPLAVMNLMVLGSSTFDVNGFRVDRRQVSPDGVDADPVAPVSLLVFSPNLYSVTVDSALSTAEGLAVLADAPMVNVPVTVQTKPTDEFVKVVQQRVEEFLTACSTQQVLQPTGCPFGFIVRNRVEKLPTWSITQQPTVEVLPNGAGWVIPDADAVAHIDLEVRSLADGSLREVSEDVPFVVNGTIDILPDGTASIRVGGYDPGL